MACNQICPIKSLKNMYIHTIFPHIGNYSRAETISETMVL